MSLPTARDVTRIAEQLETTARWLHGSGTKALNAKRTVESQDRKPTERGADDVKLTATEREAAQRMANEWLDAQQLNLRHLMGTVYDNAVATVESLDRIVKATTEPVEQETTSAEPVCAELYCEDPASPKHGGYCRADYDRRWRYRQTHNGEPPPPVSRQEIDDRIKLRENAKVHVTGPFAEGP